MRPSLLLLALVVALPLTTTAQSVDALDYRPLVLTGADLEVLLAAAPANAPSALRAFAYQDGAWTPIPTQVLERILTDLAYAYPEEVRTRSNLDPDAIDDVLVYADADHLIGADPDPTIDADDQVLLLPATFGGPAPPGSAPAGLAAERLTRVQVGGRTAYLALAPDAAPVPSAGVRYDYAPVNEPYAYVGANPEASVVTTPYYERRFSDRWIEDELYVRPDPADAFGPDLLDGTRSGYDPGNCARTEVTASESRGAPVANVCGPVACVRSVVGFNSGPLTQLTYLFFPRYTEARIDLRVHPVPGVSFWRDWEPTAQGATYVSNLFPMGVPVDGQPEPTEGELRWDALLLPQSALVSAWLLDSDVPEWRLEAIWLDDTQPDPAPCTGDASYYGASGAFVETTVAISTDPRYPDYRLLGSTARAAVAPRLTPAEAGALGAALYDDLEALVEAHPVDLDDERPGAAALTVALYPNPAPEAATARVTLPAAGRVTLRVFDLLGRVVATVPAGTLGAGPQTLPLPVAHLAPGTYVVRVDAASGVVSERLVVR